MDTFSRPIAKKLGEKLGVDVIGGTVAFMFDTLNTSMPHIQGEKLRALAVTSPER